MVLAKAPIRSRSSDRLVRVPGQEPDRRIQGKAQSRSHVGSDPTLAQGTRSL